MRPGGNAIMRLVLRRRPMAQTSAMARQNGLTLSRNKTRSRPGPRAGLCSGRSRPLQEGGGMRRVCSNMRLVMGGRCPRRAMFGAAAAV